MDPFAVNAVGRFLSTVFPRQVFSWLVLLAWGESPVFPVIRGRLFGIALGTKLSL
jgi:hypothetical protein